VAYLNTRAGDAAVVMVGSCQVGSVHMAVDSHFKNQKDKAVESRRFTVRKFQKGQEIGWFDFGSTVILLFEPGMIAFVDTLKIDDEIIMGEKVALFTSQC
ncbi:MAG TPA: phosphatidylserine decarboxylase, partial [Bacillota bacterium]|nr:phosphatidylserine decarboxylase [Bacillota bacterium]